MAVKNKLVPKYLSGRGLIRYDNQSNTTWGNRGKGNELQSAFENGTTWILQLPERIDNLLSNRGWKTNSELGYNPNNGILTGTAPLPGGKIDKTKNILKFLGSSKVKGNPINPNMLSSNELKLYLLFKKEGVDVSKLSLEDLTNLITKRINVISETIPNLSSIVTYPRDINSPMLTEYTNGKPSGSAFFDIPSLSIEDVHNISKGLVKGVYERVLNSGINIMKSEGKDGLISGRTLMSAPKQYKVLQRFNRQKIGNYGIHTNSGMVHTPSRITTSMLDLKRASNKESVTLRNAPVWKLTIPTRSVNTKSVVFNPNIIDEQGKMHINWNNPNPFMSIVPIGGFYLMNNDN